MPTPIILLFFAVSGKFEIVSDFIFFRGSERRGSAPVSQRFPWILGPLKEGNFFLNLQKTLNPMPCTMTSPPPQKKK